MKNVGDEGNGVESMGAISFLAAWGTYKDVEAARERHGRGSLRI